MYKFSFVGLIFYMFFTLLSIMNQFEKSAMDVMKLKRDPLREEMLDVYALYKQATIGDCNTECPTFWDVKGSAKWNAWNAKKGISSELAKSAYITLIDNLKNRYGFFEQENNSSAHSI